MIIGLYSPRPQCGKTTAAQHLSIKHGFASLHFASALKKMLEGLFMEMGVPLSQAWHYLYGSEKETHIPELGGVTGRQLMQTLGTEWGRESVDEDFWTRVLEAKIHSFTKSVRGGHIVVDDMRFPNEYQMLRDNGAVMVKVFRGEHQIPAPGRSHVSEGALDHHDFDFEISNNSDLSVLYAKMDSIVKQESKVLFH